jgi:chromosome partitioning protein
MFDVMNSKQLYQKLGISENTAFSLLEKGYVKAINSGAVRKKWHIPEMFLELFLVLAKEKFGDKPKNELALDVNQYGLDYRLSVQSAKTICFGNIKGGVGKTSVSCNIAYILSMLDQKVLVVDADAQANTTDFLMKNDEALCDSGLGIKVLFEKATTRQQVTKEDVMRNIIPSKMTDGNMVLDLLPSDIGLARQIEVGRAAADNPYRILKKILDTVKDEYDFIIIDTPPSPGLALQMSIYAADEMVLVTEASGKSIKGVNELIKEIQYAEVEFEGGIKMESIFITKHKPTTNIHEVFTGQIVEIASSNNISNVYAIRATTIEEQASALCVPLITYKEELNSQLGTVKSMIEYSVKQVISKATKGVAK